VCVIRSGASISRYSPWKATSSPSFVAMTYRQEPPTRRSTVAEVTVPCRPAHHRSMSAGSVSTRHTRCRGALNSRVTRISVSLGSVRTALPLVVVVMSVSFVRSCLRFRLRELVQHVVDQVAPLVPEALVARDPGMHRPQRRTVHPVETAAPVVAHVHQPYLPQHPQMLGHLRLSEPEQLDEVAHRELAARQGVEDLAPARLRHRVERVGRGRCSCHGSN